MMASVMDPYKVNSILTWKTPTNQDLLCGFLGSFPWPTWKMTFQVSGFQWVFSMHPLETLPLSVGTSGSSMHLTTWKHWSKQHEITTKSCLTIILVHLRFGWSQMAVQWALQGLSAKVRIGRWLKLLPSIQPNYTQLSRTILYMR